MSGYAQIVEPLPCWIQSTGEKVDIGPGIEIKCVKIVDGTIFRFEALFEFPDEISWAKSAWVLLETEADLPAYTDRGRAQRAERSTVTMRKGRPQTHAVKSTKTIGVKLTPEQHDWISSHAASTLSEFVRETLVMHGMPK